MPCPLSPVTCPPPVLPPPHVRDDLREIVEALPSGGWGYLNFPIVTRYARTLGLDQVIDYATTPFEKEVRDVDVVLDTIGGDTQERSWGVLKPGGILVSTIQAPSEETAAAHGVRQAFLTSSPPIKEVLTEMATLVDSGQVKPHVSAVFPLRDIKKAHSMVERRHTRGKVALQVMQ